MNAICIIPARSGSKGLPGKNTKLFHNKPLISYPIKAAKNSKFISNVVCSTDCQAIRDIAIDNGAEAPFLRPSRLSQDNSSSYEAVKHCLDFYEQELKLKFDFVLLLEPTSPLTHTTDIDKAFNLLTKEVNAEAIVSVGMVSGQHPNYLYKIDQKGYLQKYENSSTIWQRQKLDPLYYPDGSLYLSKLDSLIKHKSFYHQKTISMLLPSYKNIEIDDITDFHIAENLYYQFMFREKNEK